MAANISTTSLPCRLGNDDGIETNEYGILDDSFQFSVTSAPTTTVSSTLVEQAPPPPPSLQQSSLPGSVEMGYISSSHSESETSVTSNTFVYFDRLKSLSPHRDGPPPIEATKYTQNATTENEYWYTSFTDTLAHVSVIEQEEPLEYTVEEFDVFMNAAPSDEKDQNIASEDLRELLNYSGSSSEDSIDRNDEESSTYSDLVRRWEARLGHSPRRKKGSDGKTSVFLSNNDSLVDIVDMRNVNQHWSEQFLFDDTPQACMCAFDSMLDYLDLSGPTCIQRLPSRDGSDTSQSSRSIEGSRKATDENTINTEDSHFEDSFCCDIETNQEIQLRELLHPTDSNLSTKDGEAYMCGCIEMSNTDHIYTKNVSSNSRKRHKLAHTTKRIRSSLEKNESFNGLETIDEIEESEEDDNVVSSRPRRLDSEDSPLFGDLDFHLHWDEEEFEKRCLAPKVLDTTLETADESTSMSYSTFSC